MFLQEGLNGAGSWNPVACEEGRNFPRSQESDLSALKFLERTKEVKINGIFPGKLLLCSRVDESVMNVAQFDFYPERRGVNKTLSYLDCHHPRFTGGHPELWGESDIPAVSTPNRSGKHFG